jgi:hypothetical protein
MPASARGRCGARNLTRQAGTIGFRYHHAVADLQAKLIGLGNHAFATGIRADDEFHRLTTRGALFDGRAGSATGKGANHATHGAGAPITTNGAAQKATPDGTRSRADAAA